jgi:hypothetical protein
MSLLGLFGSALGALWKLFQSSLVALGSSSQLQVCNTLEGGFTEEEICCFLELTDLPCCYCSWAPVVRLSHGNHLLRGHSCNLCG